MIIYCQNATCGGVGSGECVGGAEVLAGRRYGAELEDGHLRCRWGEGEGCYRGGEQDGDQHRRRWELSYVHQIDLDELGLDGTPLRLRLPRKAAFFTTVAAEAMSQCMGPDANPRAASLWFRVNMEARSDESIAREQSKGTPDKANQREQDEQG
jgi:hypothetical protein